MDTITSAELTFDAGEVRKLIRRAQSRARQKKRPRQGEYLNLGKSKGLFLSCCGAHHPGTAGRNPAQVYRDQEFPGCGPERRHGDPLPVPQRPGDR